MLRGIRAEGIQDLEFLDSNKPIIVSPDFACIRFILNTEYKPSELMWFAGPGNVTSAHACTWQTQDIDPMLN